MWNKGFKGTGHQSGKESDPWEMRNRPGSAMIAPALQERVPAAGQEGDPGGSWWSPWVEETERASGEAKAARAGRRGGSCTEKELQKYAWGLPWGFSGQPIHMPVWGNAQGRGEKHPRGWKWTLFSGYTGPEHEIIIHGAPGECREVFASVVQPNQT